MEKMEESYKLLEIEEKRYAEVVKRFEENKKICEAEEKGIEQEISELREKRKELASQIRQELYDNYSKVLRIGKGVAVVPIKGSSCSGCHMSLPPQLINDVRKNEEIIDCSNCHRILYYEGLEGS
jgi:predicted  nucleic acid-binding Zn-ribbon protein